MSTYGDRGNLLYISHFLRIAGIDHQVIVHRYGDVIPFADIYLFGGGQDKSQLLVAQDLQRSNGRRLRDYLSNSYCLAICGGFQLLGKFYIPSSGQLIPGLGYLPISTVASNRRAIGPVVAQSLIYGKERTIVGFENHSGNSYILDDSPPLGHIKVGHGNNNVDKTEGIIYGKTIGSYLHGPLIPRNPHLLGWWLRDLTVGLVGQPISFPLEQQAHQRYLKQLGWL